MAITLGAQGESTVLNALYDVDFDPIVPFLVGEEGKLAKFLMRLGGEESLMETFARWAYTQAIDSVDTVAVAPASTAALSFTVSTPGAWEPYAVVLHAPSKETLVIDTVDNSTGVVTVFGRARGVAAAAWSPGDELIRMGTAYPPGSSINQARSFQEVSVDNYAQIFWEPVEIDNTTIAINQKKGLHGGDFVARERKKKYLQFMRDMDYAHTFGESSNSSVRTMGGINPFVASTETATIATLSEANFENHLATKGLIDGSEKKLMLTSAFVATGLNQYATTKLQTSVGGTKYGYKLSTYSNALGELTVMPHYNFSKSTALKGTSIIIDLTNVQRAVLRPMKLYADIEVGTRDVRMDAWLAECTAKWGHPRHHSKILGTTAFA
jgi:hypothetical protein